MMKFLLKRNLKTTQISERTTDKVKSIHPQIRIKRILEKYNRLRGPSFFDQNAKKHSNTGKNKTLKHHSGLEDEGIPRKQGTDTLFVSPSGSL